MLNLGPGDADSWREPCRSRLSLQRSPVPQGWTQPDLRHCAASLRFLVKIRIALYILETRHVSGNDISQTFSYQIFFSVSMALGLELVKNAFMSPAGRTVVTFCAVCHGLCTIPQPTWQDIGEGHGNSGTFTGQEGRTGQSIQRMRHHLLRRPGSF